MAHVITAYCLIPYSETTLCNITYTSMPNISYSCIWLFNIFTIVTIDMYFINYNKNTLFIYLFIYIVLVIQFSVVTSFS